MTDTVELLKECNKGSVMAISSIDEVIDRVTDENFRKKLEKSKSDHEVLEKIIVDKLSSDGKKSEDPSLIAKGMSYLKTNFMLSVDESDHTIADLMTEGCSMGIKSLNKYLNEYENADFESKILCKKLISLEERLCDDIKMYL